MEVSNETIDDLFEIIDSLVKENAQLKNKLNLYKNYRSYMTDNPYDNLDSYNLNTYLKDFKYFFKK